MSKNDKRIKMTNLEAEAISIVRELLKYGEHDGPCDNTYTDEDGEVCHDGGSCSLHWNASAERRKKAEAFLLKVQKEYESVSTVQH